MDTPEAARHWASTWEAAWPRRDADAIAVLYADGAHYRALAFREPDEAADYLRRTFAGELDVDCRFGEPLVAGDRAAVEWWASWVEGGEELTLAGVTLLRFDRAGLVTDHRDYWNRSPGRVVPYPGWG